MHLVLFTICEIRQNRRTVRHSVFMAIVDTTCTRVTSDRTNFESGEVNVLLQKYTICNLDRRMGA